MQKITAAIFLIFNLVTVNYYADTVSFDPSLIKADSKVSFVYSYSDPTPICPEVASEEGETESCEISGESFQAEGTISSQELAYEQFDYNETIFDYSQTTFSYVDENGVNQTADDASISKQGVYTINSLPSGTESYEITIPIIKQPFRSSVTFSAGEENKSYSMPKNDNIEITYSNLESLIYLDSPQTSTNNSTITNSNISDLLGVKISDGGTDITSSFKTIDDKSTSIDETAPFKIGAYGLNEEKITFTTTDTFNIRDRWSEDSSSIPSFDKLYFDIMAIMGEQCLPYEINYSTAVTIDGQSFEFIDTVVDGIDGYACLESSRYNPEEGKQFDYNDFITYDISFDYKEEMYHFDKDFNHWYPTQYVADYNFETGTGEILDSFDEVQVNPVYMRFEFDDLSADEEQNYYTFIENIDNMSHDIIDGKVEFTDLSFSFNAGSKIPDYWDKEYFSDVTIDRSPVLVTNLYDEMTPEYVSYFPKILLDDTIRLPAITIEDEQYYNTSYLIDSKGNILSKFVIERFSGRIYNKDEETDCELLPDNYQCDELTEVASYVEETDDVTAIRNGQNDANDVDMVLNTLSEKGFPLKSNLLTTRFDYTEIIDGDQIGYNKLDITFRTDINFESKMYGYSPRNKARYYFTRVDISDDEVDCVDKLQSTQYSTIGCGVVADTGGIIFNGFGIKDWLSDNIIANFPTYISDNRRYQQYATDASAPIVYNLDGSDLDHREFNSKAITLNDIDYELWANNISKLDANPNTDFQQVASYLNVGAWDDEDGDVTSHIKVNFLNGQNFCGIIHSFNLRYVDESGISSNSLRVTINIDPDTIPKSADDGTGGCEERPIWS